MKKIVCLVVCMALMFSTPVTTLAYEGIGSGGVPYSGSGEIVLSTKVYSSCTVSIPESMYLDNETTCEVKITTANLAVGDYIKVSAFNLTENDNIVLRNYNSSSVFEAMFHRSDETPVTRYDPTLATFSNADFSQDGTAVSYFGISLSGDKIGVDAGIYEGIMQYEVRIEQY